MPTDTAKLSVDQLRKLVQTDKQNSDRTESNLVKVRKSAAELTKAAKAVAEISKKNPEQ